MPKGVQKATKIETKNDPRSDFWAFWAEPKFRRFWGKKKVDRKSRKRRAKTIKRTLARLLREGSAAEGWPGEALESEDF